MTLNKFDLKNNFEKIFNNSNYKPDSINQTAKLMTDSIILYLKEVLLTPIEKPGVNKIPTFIGSNEFITIVDPLFQKKPLKSVISVEFYSKIIEDAFELDMNVNYKTNKLGTWSHCNAAFKSYVDVTFSSFENENGYFVEGKMLPSSIDLSIAFNSLKDNTSILTEELSNIIHNFFINCSFVGEYKKDIYFGTEPHVATLF
jgi:hypothetical protein